MKFGGIQKSSLVDYPGYVSCILFLPGCNLSCFYCHNRPLIDGTQPLLEEDEVYGFLKKRAGVLDAVVVTGGEPTLYPDLIPLLKKIKAMGYLIKLDTNGMKPDIVRDVLGTGLVSYFAVDYKAPKARYPEICGDGADGDTVLSTIRLIADSGIPFEVRTTVIPQLAESDLLTMANELPPLPRYMLNRFRKPDKFLPCDEQRVSAKPYTQLQIEAFVKQVQTVQPHCVT